MYNFLRKPISARLHYVIVYAFILFLFPFAFAKANYSITTNSGVGGLWSIGAGEHTNYAMPFTTIGAGDLTDGDWCFYTASSPTGNVYIDVETDSGGSPDGISLGTATLDAASLPVGSGSAARVPITYTPHITLASGTKYWYVVSRANTDGLVVACGQNLDGFGKTSDNNGASWNTTGSDVNIVVNISDGSGGGGGDSGFVATSTQVFDATTTPIDNPTQDFANGLFLFLTGFFGMVYLFGKRK